MIFYHSVTDLPSICNQLNTIICTNFVPQKTVVVLFSQKYGNWPLKRVSEIIPNKGNPHQISKQVYNQTVIRMTHSG